MRANFIASCWSAGSSSGGLDPEERPLSSSGFRDQEGEGGVAPGGVLSQAGLGLPPCFSFSLLRPSFSPFPPLASVAWLEASIVPAWLPLSLLLPSLPPLCSQPTSRPRP